MTRWVPPSGRSTTRPRVGVAPVRVARVGCTRFALAVLGLILVAACTTAATPTTSASPHTDVASACVREDGSAARAWIEVTLDAIRRDLPAPTIHARNLYHLSVGMWDVWAAADPSVHGVLVDVGTPAPLASQDDRQTAMAHAAHTILTRRYGSSVGAEASLAAFDQLLAECADPTRAEAAEFGDQVGQMVLEATIDDGSNEANGYDAPHEPVNAPLEVVRTGTTLVDPDHWQPLQLEQMVTQNGIPQATTVQSYVGYGWGGVTAFALPTDGGLDPGPPPRLTDDDGGAAYRAGALAVLRASSELDPRDGRQIDISPATRGGSTVGTDDGTGYPTNPVTGVPYTPQVVAQADYQRAVAEFWADGPTSETPPGHWNTLAGQVSDTIEDLRVAGAGDPVDRLEWDVKLYLALNGALHDAAVAAWGLKARYDSIRPISMIRWLGGNGQSSDPGAPAYDPTGLPLEEGLIEVVTTESSAPGEQHEELADHVGQVAVRTWTPRVGTAGDPLARVRWILAGDWVPYQRPTFVTPAFAGYVSGHSTFSRAGADMLTTFTGSPWFPGGLGSWTVSAGSLVFEDGPATDVRLEWASFGDAADEAGRSRIYGGIHVPEDDHAGRLLGAAIARSAWERAQAVFAVTD